MSLYTPYDIPTDIIIELGACSQEKGFTIFFSDLAEQGFLLEYQEDRNSENEEVFQALVRMRWETMKRAWRLRNG